MDLFTKKKRIPGYWNRNFGRESLKNLAGKCCYWAFLIITFFFDSFYVCVFTAPLAFVLANFTALPIVPLYLFCQLADIGKCVVGLIFIKKGIWIQNIVQKESTHEKHAILPEA